MGASLVVGIGNHSEYPPRLVTLSACDLGQGDRAAPDAFVGFPAAFLEAGAMGVVSARLASRDLEAGESAFEYGLKASQLNRRSVKAHWQI